MNSGDEPQYYIRSRGRILGPFQIRRLLALRVRGQFSRASQVSLDKVHWMPVEDVPDLASHLPSLNSVEATSAPGNLPLVPDSDSSLASDDWNQESSGGRRIYWTIGLSLAVVALVVWLVPIYQAGMRRYRSVITQVPAAVDDNRLPEAVGRVVCGIRLTLKNGTIKERGIGSGTCFVISRAGHALTNSHVVEEVSKLLRSPEALDATLAEKKEKSKGEIVSLVPFVTVFFQDRQRSAEIIHVSSDFDMAILQIRPSGSTVFALSVDDEVSQGTQAYALGFPGAAEVATDYKEAVRQVIGEIAAEWHLNDPDKDVTIREFHTANAGSFTMSAGIVGRIRESSGVTLIQHDVSINPGNSGGPLVTSDGIVRGINTSMHKEAKGIYFAVATGQLREEIDAVVPDVVWK